MKHYTVVEHDLEMLDEEAKLWLENDATDLVMLKPDFRRKTILCPWETDPAYSIRGWQSRSHRPTPQMIAKFYSGQYGPHIMDVEVDAILFASTADAVYFKLRFM